MRPTRRRPRVVVVGMGDTGSLVAVRAARHADVVGISTKPVMLSGQELGGRLTDIEQWRRNYLLPFGTIGRLDDVRIHHGKLTEIDLDARSVHHPRVRRRIARVLEDSGVRVHPGHRAVVPEGFAGDRMTTGPLAWSTGQEPIDRRLVEPLLFRGFVDRVLYRGVRRRGEDGGHPWPGQ